MAHRPRQRSGAFYLVLDELRRRVAGPTRTPYILRSRSASTPRVAAPQLGRTASARRLRLFGATKGSAPGAGRRPAARLLLAAWLHKCVAAELQQSPVAMQQRRLQRAPAVTEDLQVKWRDRAGRLISRSGLLPWMLTEFTVCSYMPLAIRVCLLSAPSAARRAAAALARRGVPGARHVLGEERVGRPAPWRPFAAARSRGASSDVRASRGAGRPRRPRGRRGGRSLGRRRRVVAHDAGERREVEAAVDVGGHEEPRFSCPELAARSRRPTRPAAGTSLSSPPGGRATARRARRRVREDQAPVWERRHSADAFGWFHTFTQGIQPIQISSGAQAPAAVVVARVHEARATVALGPSASPPTRTTHRVGASAATAASMNGPGAVADTSARVAVEARESSASTALSKPPSVSRRRSASSRTRSAGEILD